MQSQPNATLKTTIGEPLFKLLFGVLLLENVENLYSLIKHSLDHNLVVFIILLLFRVTVIGLAIFIITKKMESA